VRIIVSTAPGGLPDILARLIGPWLSGRLDQQFVIENRPGGGSTIGTEAVVRAPIGAPRNTPAKIIDTLNKEINAALADPKMKARIADLGGTVFAGTPTDFGKFIADETEKWAEVIRAANIRPE
jgi:tripartite-type tricarboxylate transporter receptor subunit TctC